jgi:hypothetical protein
MAKVTFEVPASVVGDVYIAVGRVLQADQDDRARAGQPDDGEREGDDGLADS